MADRYASLKQGLVGCWIPSVSGSGLLLPDLSGRGNNGSLVGMDASDWVSASYGRALDFDGSDDKVTLAMQNTASLTASCWVYSRNINNANGEYFISKWGATSLILDFYIGAFSNNWIARTGNGASSFSSLLQTPATINQWTHLAITRDTANLKLFVNGIEMTSTSAVGFQGGGSQPLEAGFLPNFYANCQLDDIRIYSRALTQPEIKLLASEPGIGFKPAKKLSRFSQRYTYKPPKARNYSVIRNRDPNYSTLRQGLVAAYCPSISGQGNVLPDLVGGNHGTLTNMTADDWVSSGDGRALEFDGTDTSGGNDTQNRVTLPKDFGVDVIGFSAWINPITLNKRGICASWPVNTAPRFAITLLTNGTLEVYRGQNTQSTAALSTNRWQHIFVFSDGNNTSYYIDGVFSNTANQQGITPGLQTNFLLGNNYWGALEGYLDDVRIYDRHLTLAEIKLLASKRGIGLEPRKPKITFADLGVQKTYSVVRVKETDYGNLRQGLVGAWCPSLPNGGSGNTLPDQSGYGNHGTLTNMGPEDWVSGQYGRALDFDNTDDYVSCSSQAVQSLASGTISFWIKTSKEVGAAFTIQQTTSTSEAFGVGIGQNWTGFFTNELVTIYRKSNNSISRLAGYTTATRTELLDNNWHHVVVKCDGAYQLFVDGISKTLTFPGAYPTNDGAFTSGLSNLTSLYFGGYRDGAAIDPINGQMDDVRVYSRGLTEPEIKLLASRPGIGLRQDRDRNTFYQFPSFQPAIARRSSAIIGGGIT